MSALAEMERGIIAERQKDVHKYRRDNGKVWGKDLGPKQRISDEIRFRIFQLKASGVSLHGIARLLNLEKIPTAYGGLWTASTIKYVLDRQKNEPEAQE